MTERKRRRRRPPPPDNKGNNGAELNETERELAKHAHSHVAYTQGHRASVSVPKRKKDDTLTPKRVSVPIPPTTDNNKSAEYNAQQVARVEILMLKGIYKTRSIRDLLGLKDLRTVRRYKNQVFARWEITAGDNALRHRGEALRRLDLIEQELWSCIDNTQSGKEKISALGKLLEVQDRRLPLQGVDVSDPDAFVRSGRPGAAESFDERLRDFRAIQEVATRFKMMLESGGRNEGVIHQNK